jgi:hypothetical protein
MHAVWLIGQDAARHADEAAKESNLQVACDLVIVPGARSDDVGSPAR